MQLTLKRTTCLAASIIFSTTLVAQETTLHTLTVIGGTGGGSYAAGDFIQIRSVPPAGTRFGDWIGDGSIIEDVTRDPTNVSMPDHDVTIQAHFIRRFLLTVVNGSGGGTFDEGVDAPIMATVPAGRTFLGWTGTGVLDPLATSTYVHISADVTVTATLDQQPPVIVDECPDDPAKTSLGVCGCGRSDIDTDGDGVLDCVDNCPTMANADQADADGDGIGDLCDNCPGTANADQADTNGNGTGDACEPAPPGDGGDSGQPTPPPDSGQETPSDVVGHFCACRCCGWGAAQAMIGIGFGLQLLRRSGRRKP